MNDLAQLHRQLLAIAHSLGDCAQMIIDLPLKPARKNLRRIAEAGAAVDRIQQDVAARDPDLLPAFFRIGPEDAGSQLGKVMADVFYDERKEDFERACAKVTAFLKLNPPCSPRHRQIAESELRRLEKLKNTRQRI